MESRVEKEKALASELARRGGVCVLCGASAADAEIHWHHLIMLFDERGNAPEQQLAKLAELWRPAGPQQGWSDWWEFVPDSWRRTGEVVGTLLSGRPGIFAPLGSTLGSIGHRRHAIYDIHPLCTALAALVDFERLNDGPVRYGAMAVDLDSGEDAVFDSKDHVIAADHIRASAALPPAFPAVPIDGRMFVDGGLSANLPTGTVTDQMCVL